MYQSGSAELSDKGRAALDVVGNTDDVPIGAELAHRYPSNWELAAARATVVVRHLQAKGVDPRRIEAISNGQYHPVVANDSPADRAKNRRTDVLMRPE